MAFKFFHPEFDEDKLKNLILYVAERAQGDANFGKTKLYKILWLSDFRHYAAQGSPITGATYVHLPRGPAPEGMDEILDELEGAGALVLKRFMRFGHVQQRPVALKSADLSDFTGSEIAVTDEVMDEVRSLTAKELSDLSHDDIGWQSTKQGELIPYESALLAPESQQPTEDDLRAAGW